MRKGQIKEYCDKCGTKRHCLKNGRYICSKCAREASLVHYHTNKKPLNDEQKEKKRLSNLKWKYTIRDSGYNNQQISTIKHRYKLSEEELISVIKLANNKCKICNIELTFDTLVIDHNHSTNKVRGILCRKCNMALGLFKDDVNILYSAINYLS